ncbi:MAG: hypothetical protein ACYCY6_00315 [Minisyncoccota bacterium]
MPIWQETGPEDRIHDAFCFAVMLHLKKRHKYTSIDGDWFLSKMKVFYSLLEFEYPEVKNLFTGIDNLKKVKDGCFFRAKIGKEVFTRASSSNRYYFEWSFDKFAENEIEKNLSPRFQSALAKIIDDATDICLSTKDWEEALVKLEMYKKNKRL